MIKRHNHRVDISYFANVLDDLNRGLSDTKRARHDTDDEGWLGKLFVMLVVRYLDILFSSIVQLDFILMWHN